MMKLGAHQSIAGGYHQALKRIKNIGGNTLQIFSSSPRGWHFPKINLDDINQFLKLKRDLQIEPIYFHASYLINLADNSKIGSLSKKSLINELILADKLGIKGSVVHLGSFKNPPLQKSYFQNNPQYRILFDNIREVLSRTPKNTILIIENAGNRKIGQALEELSFIFKQLNNPRLRLCLDTCHLFANGYCFQNKQELDSFLDKLQQLNLVDKLELWHLNDSRDPLNSGRDRHENIGQGKIGLEEFKILLNHPQTKNYPFIIETPGFSNEGPDKKNLDILKSLVK